MDLLQRLMREIVHSSGQPHIAEIARRMNAKSSTVAAAITSIGLRRLAPDTSVDANPREPTEIRNEAFWRKRYQETFDELANTQHALKEIAGLMQRPIRPPKWTMSPSSKARNAACGLLHISDVHAAEVVEPNEINGGNAYNLEICERRLKRLFAAAIEILPRWSSDCSLKGIYVALNGDLVSGDIHEELAETNELQSKEQMWWVSDRLAAGIRLLAEAFGNVYVVVTTGNHGRSTKKTRAKRTTAHSYDTMVGEALRRHFASDKRVTVMVSVSRDAEYDILGWKVLQMHGDEGGGGGRGFAGPMLPIIRKAKAAEYMASRFRKFYDIILSAHDHTSGNPGNLLANGSVIGFNEFAFSIRAAPEPPQQWLALVTQKWPLRERLDIKLEDVPRFTVVSR
jgi:hypothetical protein